MAKKVHSKNRLTRAHMDASRTAVQKHHELELAEAELEVLRDRYLSAQSAYQIKKHEVSRLRDEFNASAKDLRVKLATLEAVYPSEE